MSKSIYKQTLDIIEKNDRNLFYNWIVVRDTLIQVKQILKQAQKQEKLLELYKELSNYVSEQVYADELSKIIRLKQQIKENENE